ncbi:helix-turn-helix transcriptional regulator [Bifidobacterium imperatoris]|uniref:Helix-turn-helix transcriptional regulator n=2 Tax=Bifidobacterium imperatoris TaxID=2020965 RepID=A0A2N5IPX6_9BIFI|nr:helix-turn-helix transcriptional regulator [Bifidobacterium imperatoris]PLS23986.1 hypothetical protein Tam1G_1970 [Bifidobacterium imperatoris]QSY57815.1 helix-turn-helix transcriptional regulator [Bifidobacterium imperatoris]
MKRYRTAAKISIAKLADYLKQEYGDLALSENVLTNIELGRKTDISLDATIQIAHAVHVTPLALICDLEEPFLLGDNPIFGNKTKYGICRLFLSEMIVPSGPMNNAMNRIKGILDEAMRYWTGVNNYRVYSETLRRALRKEISYDPDSSESDELGPNFAYYYLTQSIADIKKSVTVLETIGVTIPESEKENLKKAQKSLKTLHDLCVKSDLFSDEEIERISDAFDGVNPLPSERPLTVTD